MQTLAQIPENTREFAGWAEKPDGKGGTEKVAVIRSVWYLTYNKKEVQDWKEGKHSHWWVPAPEWVKNALRIWPKPKKE